jgi:hypothetical protein
MRRSMPFRPVQEVQGRLFGDPLGDLCRARSGARGPERTGSQGKAFAYEVTTYGIDDLDRAIADGEAHGFIKVLTVPGKDRILGVTIVGEHAGDLIAEYVLAMKQGIGLNKILGTIHIYPTLAEANKYVAGNWKKAHAPESCWPGSNVSTLGGGDESDDYVEKIARPITALALNLACRSPQHAEPLWVGRFNASDPAIPAPWKIERLNDKFPPTRYALRQWDGVQAIEATRDKSMALFGRTLAVDLKKTPILCWQWRIDAPVASADMNKKSGDDYAARVYLTFTVPPEALGFATRTKLSLARSIYGRRCRTRRSITSGTTSSRSEP